MDATCARGSFWDSVTPALRKLLKKPFRFDDPNALPLWKKYLATRSRAAADELCQHYLPLVGIVALRLKKRRPWLFPEELGYLISDGFMGLRQFIEYADAFDPLYCSRTAFRQIRRWIFRCRTQMEFGGWHRAYARRTLSDVRAKLTRQLGRLPEREEILRELRAHVKNPAMVIARIDETPPRVSRFSELGSSSLPPLSFADPAADDPSKQAIESDIMRRVVKVLKPRDRQILRLILRGETYADIGRRFHISRERVRQRLNGILWEARQRADLATYFGDDPIPEIRPLRQGKDRCLASAPGFMRRAG
ncbi:MAG: sigma-70 family RNA polymerase sigma factor [Tepidisphaeraceae bacterium]